MANTTAPQRLPVSKIHTKQLLLGPQQQQVSEPSQNRILATSLPWIRSVLKHTQHNKTGGYPKTEPPKPGPQNKQQNNHVKRQVSVAQKSSDEAPKRPQVLKETKVRCLGPEQKQVFGPPNKNMVLEPRNKFPKPGPQDNKQVPGNFIPTHVQHGQVNQRLLEAAQELVSGALQRYLSDFWGPAGTLKN